MAAPVIPNAGTPLSYLQGFGTKAYPVVSLTWGLMIISIAVTVLIAVLVVIGILLKRSRAVSAADVPVMRGAGGGAWIVIGLGISSVALLGSLVWTVVVLAAINGPGRKPGLTIEVTGQQWWWKARYLSDDPSRTLTTANEFHIPTGEPVRVRLIGADVIHSFWVPALSGKTDTIPGQTNVTWIEAQQPGRYEGQCTEYCGVEHAEMLFRVVAQSPADFHAWWVHQLLAPVSTNGRQAFVQNCGRCHSMRGTAATGTLGPDLSHLMERQTIASGALPNNARAIAAWIANPPAIKPGTLMPAIKLSDGDRAGITNFLLAQN